MAHEVVVGPDAAQVPEMIRAQALTIQPPPELAVSDAASNFEYTDMIRNRVECADSFNRAVRSLTTWYKRAPQRLQFSAEYANHFLSAMWNLTDTSKASLDGLRQRAGDETGDFFPDLPRWGSP